MIIVSGRIYVKPSERAAFLARSLDAVVKARVAPGCLDFVVAGDPLDEGRVNVYESWESRAALETFRGAGPDDDLGAMILRADVSEHELASPPPA